jgi:hypothetical protein
VLRNEGGAIDRVTLEQYDKASGKTVTVMSGSLSSGDAAQFSGALTAVGITGDNMLASTSIAGSMTVAGNTVDVGLGAASTTVGGTVTSLVQSYTDGSNFSISGSLAASATLALDERILSDSAYFTGDDTISVSLPATLSSAYAINGGDGNDRITITGGGGKLSAHGGNGNDIIVLGDHGHAVTGGAGLDSVVFSGARATYAVAASATAAGASTVTALGGAADTLSGIERIQFDNASVALDITGNAGQAYRLYQAAFNRTPDLGGLGYWIKQMDNGMSLLEMAANFTHAPEFTTLYGANPTSAELVNNFYRNALHREAEPAGFAYWLDVLDRKLVTAVEMLAMFSESVENQAAVQPAILTGIAYTPYG